MPTVMTHALVPLAIGAALGPKIIPPRVMVAGALLAMLPDADVIGFRFGIGYADVAGHRGISHALSFALIVAGLVTWALRPARPWVAFAFLSGAMMTHGLLDSFNRTGYGAMLYWPFDTGRYFAPVTPLRVSPIGWNFFGDRALPVLWKELPKVKELSDKMVAETGKLAVAAKSGNLDQLKAAFGPAAQTCKACHDDFRKK